MDYKGGGFVINIRAPDKEKMRGILPNAPLMYW